MKKILFTIVLIVCTMIYYSCSDASAIVAKPETTVTTIPIKEKTVVAKRVYNEKIIPHIEFVLGKLINNDVNYDWYDFTSCNVGLFAQLCTNSSPKHIEKRFDREYADYMKFANERNFKYRHSWKQVISYYCGISGKPIEGIVNDLLVAGFKREDISHLEFLDDPYILSQSTINTDDTNFFVHRHNFINYLQTWINILKAQ